MGDNWAKRGISIKEILIIERARSSLSRWIELRLGLCVWGGGGGGFLGVFYIFNLSGPPPNFYKPNLKDELNKTKTPP
ncbi:hypothetical protein AB6C57_14460, partial [Vibrio splendidus]